MEYVTTVVPTRKVSPGKCEEDDSRISQLSCGTGAGQITTEEHCPASAVIEISSGIPAMVGSSLSVTVTKNFSLEKLP